MMGRCVACLRAPCVCKALREYLYQRGDRAFLQEFQLYLREHPEAMFYLSARDEFLAYLRAHPEDELRGCEGFDG